MDTVSSIKYEYRKSWRICLSHAGFSISRISLACGVGIFVCSGVPFSTPCVHLHIATRNRLPPRTMEQPKVDSDIYMLGCFGDRDGLAKCADSGTDMTATDMYGRSPLHWAARAGRNECCTYLMGIDLDKDAADDAGMTPLLHAAQNGMETTVKILCDNGCDANSMDNCGNSAMHYAVSKGILGMVQILKEKGASLTSKNKSGFTPAHVCSQNGQLVITRYLVKTLEGKDLDIGNEAGNTPLHIASACGFKNICKNLLEAGCDANKTNSSGEKPVDVATGDAASAFE